MAVIHFVNRKEHLPPGFDTNENGGMPVNGFKISLEGEIDKAGRAGGTVAVKQFYCNGANDMGWRRISLNPATIAFVTD